MRAALHARAGRIAAASGCRRFGLGMLAVLAADESGEEDMEYLLILAMVVLPMVVAARMMWAVLLNYFTIGAFVIDSPLF